MIDLTDNKAYSSCKDQKRMDAARMPDLTDNQAYASDAKMPSGMDPKIDIDIEASRMRVSGEDGCHMVRTDDRGG